MLYKYSQEADLLMQVELNFGVRALKFLNTGVVVTGSGGQLALINKNGEIQW